MKKKYKFIVIEGIDGSGKTTFLQKIKKKYNNIYITHEPFLPFVRLLLDNFFKKNKKIRGLLFYIDRIFHIYTPFIGILAKLKKKNVICDRYSVSTQVYNNFTFNFLIKKPDVVVCFLINPEEAGRRIKKRDGQTADIEMLKDLQKKYIEICKKKKYIVVGKTNTKQDFFEEKIKIIENIIGDTK